VSVFVDSLVCGSVGAFAGVLVGTFVCERVRRRFRWLIDY
jgi:hypothetical protein